MESWETWVCSVGVRLASAELMAPPLQGGETQLGKISNFWILSYSQGWKHFAFLLMEAPSESQQWLSVRTACGQGFLGNSSFPPPPNGPWVCGKHQASSRFFETEHVLFSNPGMPRETCKHPLLICSSFVHWRALLFSLSKSSTITLWPCLGSKCSSARQNY